MNECGWLIFRPATFATVIGNDTSFLVQRTKFILPSAHERSPWAYLKIKTLIALCCVHLVNINFHLLQLSTVFEENVTQQ